MERDNKWLYWAIQLALRAQFDQEVPVGAVIVQNESIVGIGWNQTIQKGDPTAHAEINAIQDAARNTKNYRLTNAVLYVSLEPCWMCLGAILNARLKKVVFGVPDNHKSKQEHALKNLSITQCVCLNPEEKKIVTGYQGLLQDFFKSRR